MFKAIQTLMLVGASAVKLQADRIDPEAAFKAAAAGTYTKHEAMAFLVQTVDDLAQNPQGVADFITNNKVSVHHVDAVLDGVNKKDDAITKDELNTAL